MHGLAGASAVDAGVFRAEFVCRMLRMRFAAEGYREDLPNAKASRLWEMDPNALGLATFRITAEQPTKQVHILPKEWIRPAGATAGAWSNAPGTAFPTYSFAVNSGAGLNLAIPVSGVPVGPQPARERRRIRDRLDSELEDPGGRHAFPLPGVGVGPHFCELANRSFSANRSPASR